MPSTASGLEGTLNRLVSQPVYRDSVINGKFLAGATMIFLMVFSMGILTGAIGFWAIGIPPGGRGAGKDRGISVFYCGLYLLLAGAVHPVLRPVPPCRHIGYAGDRPLDILCIIYEPGGQHSDRYPVSGRQDVHRVCSDGLL